MKTLITLILTTFSLMLFGQKSVLYCNGNKYDQYSGAWSDIGQNCKNEYFIADYQKDISPKNTSIVNNIKLQILTRGGNDFYNQLNLEAIIISKPSSKCNDIKYTFRYIFKIDSSFYYRFSLTYDKNGKQIGKNAFPSVDNNPNFFQLSSACNAIDNSVNDSTFVNFYQKIKLDKIDKVSLDFDNELNTFVYKIYGITLFESSFGDNRCVTGWWYGKVVIVNAQTGNYIKTENYKEYKTVTF